tara:strand:- start:1002 stop:1391 length:390 start_codon:yes stop_codon:yes gene_type:complete
MKDGEYFLKDMHITKWIGDKFWGFPIQESPFYRTLVESDRTIYDDYRNLFFSTHKRCCVCSYENYMKLYESIEKCWNSSKGNITLEDVDDLNRIADGHHRASILLHLYPIMKVVKVGLNIYPNFASVED